MAGRGRAAGQDLPPAGLPAAAVSAAAWPRPCLPPWPLFSSAASPHQAAWACAFSEISYPGKMTFTHENRLLKIRLQRWESLCASSSSVVLISAGFVAL